MLGSSLADLFGVGAGGCVDLLNRHGGRRRTLMFYQRRNGIGVMRWCVMWWLVCLRGKLPYRCVGDGMGSFVCKNGQRCFLRGLALRPPQSLPLRGACPHGTDQRPVRLEYWLIWPAGCDGQVAFGPCGAAMMRPMGYTADEPLRAASCRVLAGH
jgi:hypothetical protein